METVHILDSLEFLEFIRLLSGRLKSAMNEDSDDDIFALIAGSASTSASAAPASASGSVASTSSVTLVPTLAERQNL